MSGVLVDTSVWVGHFRNRNDALVNLLGRDLVLTHPFVVGEIACGTPPAPRIKVLGDMGLLTMVLDAGVHETMAFIERESVYGAGCGLVDMVLLASTLITPGAKLWTLDKRLAALAERCGAAYGAPITERRSSGDWLMIPWARRAHWSQKVKKAVYVQLTDSKRAKRPAKPSRSVRFRSLIPKFPE